MQSSITPQFICGVFLLLVGITSPRKLRDIPKNEEHTRNPHLIIEQITDPVQNAKNPHWDHRSKKLYFVDVYMQKIYRLDPATGELTHAYIANGPVGAVVPVDGRPHKFVVGTGKDLALITWDSDKNCSDPIIEVLGTVDKDRNITHVNDGKVDSHGRLWAGTIGKNSASRLAPVNPNQGSLYRLTFDRVIKKEISPVSISNGIAWNKKDTTMYYIDTLTRQIAAYDFDAEHGKISNKRIVFDLPSRNISGQLNGMTIDTKDNLWIPLYDGGNIINVDPVHGKLLQSIKIPAGIVSSVAWGGNLFDILYVSTSRNKLTPAQIAAEPKSGSVFAIKGLGARGYAANLFSLKHRKH